MHPLNGVSWADGADPQGDCSLATSTQRRLRLLLPHWPGHLHPACRYPRYLDDYIVSLIGLPCICVLCFCMFKFHAHVYNYPLNSINVKHYSVWSWFLFCFDSLTGELQEWQLALLCSIAQRNSSSVSRSCGVMSSLKWHALCFSELPVVFWFRAATAAGMKDYAGFTLIFF